MLSAIPIAVLTNSFRVTMTGVATFYYGKKALTPFWHDLSGWLVYLVALILLIGVNSLLKVLSSKFKVQSSISEIPNSKFKTQNSKFKTQNLVYALAAFLFVGGVFINWFEQRGEAEISRRPLSEFSKTLGEWKQRGDAFRFSEATESVLKTTDYTMREYTFSDGRDCQFIYRLLRFAAHGRDVSFAAELSSRRGLGFERTADNRDKNSGGKNFSGKSLPHRKRCQRPDNDLLVSGTRRKSKRANIAIKSTRF